MLLVADRGGECGGRGEGGEVLLFFVAVAALGEVMVAAMGGQSGEVVGEGFA